MALASKHLIDPVILGTSNTLIFGNPLGQRTVVAGVMFHNFSGGVATITLWSRVEPTGGAVGTPSPVSEIITKTLAAGESFVWRSNAVNLLTDHNMALFGLCSVSNAVNAYFSGAIDVLVGSRVIYQSLTEPLLIGSGTGAGSTVVFQKPSEGKFVMSGYLLHNTSASDVLVQLWHLVPGVSGAAGVPANNQKILNLLIPAKGSGSELGFRYPYPACYEDEARSFRATASTAGAVSIYVTGAAYV